MKIKVNGKDNKNQKKTIGELRKTQLITTFGPGSIADMPNYSVIMASIDKWNTYSPIIKEPNLQKLLKVDYFKEPYVSQPSDKGPKPDTMAYRFPFMHFCPKCGRLMKYYEFKGSKPGLECPECHQKLVPSRFLAACCNGHIEDFPYRWWVHRGDYSECDDKKGTHLKIEFKDTSGGLESIVITCTKCHKSRTMAGCMSKEALMGYHCNGHRPWLGFPYSETDDKKECNALMRTVQRGASNTYFALTESALTIPPWSSTLHKQLLTHIDDCKIFFQANSIDIAIKHYYQDLIDKKLATHAQIKNILDKIINGNSDSEYTRQSIREDEYMMFCAGDKNDPDFTTEHTEISPFLSSLISDVVLVKRLREVMALKGFRRLSPDTPDPSIEKFEGYHNDEDYILLSEEKQNWLPAIELHGEGIFIKLDSEKLNTWEQSIGKHYEPMGQRLKYSNVGCDYFSSRYVLLHTLSHLLIKQLTIDCGYSGSALKERIYSTYADSKNEMCGILIYTSSSDSDGSLGGLVRQGLSESLENTFRNMLQEASWCSSDPICIDSHAQGYDALNYAACHACALISETSCEMRNCLLDRASVVGTPENRDFGYFASLLDTI